MRDNRKNEPTRCEYVDDLISPLISTLYLKIEMLDLDLLKRILDAAYYDQNYDVVEHVAAVIAVWPAIQSHIQECELCQIGFAFLEQMVILDLQIKKIHKNRKERDKIWKTNIKNQIKLR